jgi:transcription elongation factor GreA
MKGAASFRDATQRAARPEAFFVIDHRFLTGRRRGSPAAAGVTIRASRPGQPITAGGGVSRPMNTKPVYLTAEGLAKLKAELSHLITSERPRVAARIHDAKQDGDISENAEYEDAKQEQSFLEGRIATLEAQLKNAEVIAGNNGDKVGIGSRVVIKGDEGEETFTIVGSAEAAPREGRISNESPVGAALMNRKKGDKVTVQTPAGSAAYTVVSIS